MVLRVIGMVPTLGIVPRVLGIVLRVLRIVLRVIGIVRTYGIVLRLGGIGMMLRRVLRVLLMCVAGGMMVSAMVGVALSV